MAYIEFEHIHKSFDDQIVLDDISISIKQGEFITLLGPSGCGKTTLLRSLAGLERVDRGKIFIDDTDVTFVEPKQRNISMIFQQYSLFPTMTVFRNVAFGLKMQKIPKNEIEQRVKIALEMVNLLGSEDKYPSQLSGGEQQRVALARAIVTKAKVLLLDEPFSAIDAKLRKALQIKIKEIHNELGLTTIFVTHDQEEALRMSDRIYLLHDGKIEQEGTPMELYLNPKTPFAAGFMGHYNLYKGEETWAIRPEAIDIARKPWESQESSYIYTNGKVKRITPQGNIIRYTLDVSGRLMDVDVLFEENIRYSFGEFVYVRYQKQHVKSW
jgi:putative spermidine/putrescine transport system ATP-binding protein